MPISEQMSARLDDRKADRSAPREESFLARRIQGLPSWVILVQIFIGVGWLRAAIEKLIDPQWWSGFEVESFVVRHSLASLDWYKPFADGFVTPNSRWVAIVVLVAEFAMAAGLITGVRYRESLALGIFLNLNFIAAGLVTPSVFYLVAQGSILLWYAESVAEPRHSLPQLANAAWASLALGLSSLPFIQTASPAEIKDDPAAMLFFICTLTFACCEVVAWRLAPARSATPLGWVLGKRRLAAVARYPFARPSEESFRESFEIDLRGAWVDASDS